MLVSHRKQFIYTKTVKTGGTSIESYFEKFCMPPGEWRQQHGRAEYESEAGVIGFRGGIVPADCRWWNHMSADLIRAQVGEQVWQRYFKFCVVRNPFDKAVSAFYFFRREHPRGAAESLDRDREEFESWLTTCGNLPLDRDKYVINGEFCMDDFIRFEFLLEDIERICGRIGVNWEPSCLPTFKKGVRPGHASVDGLYTPACLDIVSRFYDFEIERFGYQFPA